MLFWFVIFHKDVYCCRSFVIHCLETLSVWKFMFQFWEVLLNYVFDIFSCLSLELLLLRHWTLWIHALIFLPFFFSLFFFFWLWIFLTFLIVLNSKNIYYHILNYLFFVFWIHEYKILSCLSIVVFLFVLVVSVSPAFFSPEFLFLFVITFLRCIYLF